MLEHVYSHSSGMHFAGSYSLSRLYYHTNLGFLVKTVCPTALGTEALRETLVSSPAANAVIPQVPAQATIAPPYSPAPLTQATPAMLIVISSTTINPF